MIRRLLILMYVFILSFQIQASTLSAYLEVVLAEDGVLIDGTSTVTVELLSSDGELLWSEDHDTLFFKGRTAFEIGSNNKIETKWFHDTDTQLYLKLDSGQVSLPMYSTPFSFFSHAADIVNAIYMKGVFHMNLEEERIGINIDEPTASVRLEVGGAMRVGDGDEDIFNEIGMIRWRNYRLEGLHNDMWRLLDVSPADGFESKWTDNNSLLEPAFFVYDTEVRMATNQSYATLTIGGDMYVDDSLTIDNLIETAYQLNLPNDYGVTNNGSVFARSVSLNATNYLNKDDGLVVSGALYGKGHGVTNITTETLMIPAIQNNEISDLSITDELFSSSSITAQKLSNYIISRSHLMDGFKISNDYLADLILTDVEIERESISTENLSGAFEFTLNLFDEGAIVSRNIGSQNIDFTKIADSTLQTDDYAVPMIDQHDIIHYGTIVSTNIKDDDILATDFALNALTFNHLDSIITLDKGGTNQTTYSKLDGLIIVSSNQFISEDNFVLSDDGLGVYVATPSVELDILNQSGKSAILIKSTALASSGLSVANDLAEWHLGVSETGDFEIVDVGKSRDMFLMDSNGYIGLKAVPSTEKVTIGGGLMLGDTDLLNLEPGTMFFDSDQGAFKLVLDTGLTSLGPLLQQNGYFFVSNVVNQSDHSRVLLAQDSVFDGKNHIASGVYDSHIFGSNAHLSIIYATQVNGAFNHVATVFDSVINCDQSQISHLQSSVIDGRKCFVDHAKQSHFDGDNFIARHVTDSTLDGDNHRLFNVKKTRVNGDTNALDFVSASHVDGTAHYLHFVDNSIIGGSGNNVSFLKESIAEGAENSIEHSEFMALTGSNNYAGFSSYSTIVGNDHFIMHGDGIYMEHSNQHIGSGSPIVVGKNNVLIGHHNNFVESNGVISIGTSHNDINDLDNAIVFHAPGGVDILSGDYTVARLPANGGSWASVSDQRVKVNITPLNPDDLLSRVLSLSILEWNYKGQHYVQHIGPMAQDFHGEFGLGNSEKFIQSVDMDGVILGAIKGLGNYYEVLLNRLNKFSISEQKQQVKTNWLYDELNLFYAQSQTLLDADLALTNQFQDVHYAESNQSKKIDELNKDIRRMKAMIGAQK